MFHPGTRISNGKPVGDEPTLPTGIKPSALAGMDPQRAAAERRAIDARLDPECNRLYAELCWHARAALRRPGVSLTEEQKAEDVAAVEAADPATLDREHMGRFIEISAELRLKGWSDHR